MHVSAFEAQRRRAITPINLFLPRHPHLQLHQSAATLLNVDVLESIFVVLNPALAETMWGQCRQPKPQHANLLRNVAVKTV
jgi:hypothetical protein